MHEALEENPENYLCFNDFFIRKLKPHCRPLAQADIISPVDGCISEIGDIHAGQLLQAKGRYYSISDLLASNETTCSKFNNGRFATLYLSPKDYHRVHMPVTGTLTHMIHVPGKLFSVQPLTTRVIPHLFSRNERLICFFNTEVGVMVMVMVGATIVGSIGTSWHGEILRDRQTQHFDYQQQLKEPIILKQGDEMGYFKLGSTVIVLFEEGQKMDWDPKLSAGSCVRLGEAFGKFA